VDVDHPRHHRRIAQVVGHRPGALIDGDDLRSLHLDDGVGDCGAASIEHPRRADRDRLSSSSLRCDLRDRGERDHEPEEEGNGSEMAGGGHATSYRFGPLRRGSRASRRCVLAVLE
jgi:hypothetical protein